MQNKCKCCQKKHTNNNTGCDNSGDSNSGDWNSGDWNSGDSNSGDWNSGNRNSGDSNSGYWNSGNRNSGNRNSGYWNSGDRNSGNRNSGDWNSGDSNSGDWNSGDRNSGYFNTDEPKIRLFNKETNLTHSEFHQKYDVYADIPLNRWIDKEDMSTEERQNIKGWETMGGYLKTLDFKEACRIWWEENPDEHGCFTSLPNFDWKIFTEITGIEPDEPVKSKKVKIRLSDNQIVEGEIVKEAHD